MKAVDIKNYGSVANARKQGVVYVGEGTPLANKFGADLDKYRAWLYDKLEQGDEVVVEAIESLTTKSLLGAYDTTHCKVIMDAWKLWTAEVHLVEEYRELIEEQKYGLVHSC